MHRILRSTLIVLTALIFFSACNRVPDHARYIPKDAVVVAGINFKSLSKKIAWSAITGSQLFKEMQNHVPEKSSKDAMNGIDKAGLDVANTFYVYVKRDARFKDGNKVTALVPLSDAGQWEAYVKMVFPKADIKEHDNHKETMLSKGMYAGWNKKLLIFMSITSTPDYKAMTEGGMTETQNPQVDDATMQAEMNNAFNITADNAITGNKHFTKLETDGHDVTIWVNYEQIMNQMSGSMAEKMGMSLSSNLWKDAAFAWGFDFKKGKITGDMLYYMSPDMYEFGKQFGSASADADMISRLPSQNMDMLMAIHLAPEGIKTMLEKMNMLGLANLGLATQGMTVDDVLDGFTGDMAFVMNDFSLRTEKVTDTFMGQAVTHQNQKPNISMSYVLKIKKKEKFNKLLKMVKDMGLPASQNGFTVPLDEKDSIYIMINDQYAVASNRKANAEGMLQGTFKSQKLPENVSSVVNGHPCSIFVDVQQFCKNVDGSISSSASDSVMISESKKLINNVSLTGGAFSDNAFSYHLDVSFMNTEENSIVNLMDYAMKINDASKTNNH